MRPSVGLSILLALTPAFVLAQNPAPAGSEGPLQEVVVTATKQAAIDVNKVPVSISAYSEQEMDMRGIRTIGDLAAVTPGLVFSQQNNFGTPQTNIEIRGIQSRTRDRKSTRLNSSHVRISYAVF